MKVNVQNVALGLYEQGLIPQPAVGDLRREFWTKYGIGKPLQLVVTDGVVLLEPDSEHDGIMIHHVSGDPTYVLIVERNDETYAWRVVYAGFFYEDRLRKKSLVSELRLFNAVVVSHKKLEAALEELQ